MEPLFSGVARVAAVPILAGVWLLWIAIIALATIAVYRLTLHPLATVPGPRLAATSNIWLAYHARNGRMLVLGKTLHSTYGPVVRVGPNEVWFNSEDALRTIYGVGNSYVKSDFYLATLLQKPDMDWRLRYSFQDTLDLLSERDMARYRLQRRLIGPVYKAGNLRRHEKHIDRVLQRVVERLRSLGGESVDLKEWMHIIAVECLGAVVLSWSPGYLRDGTDWGSSTQGYLGWRRKTVYGLFPWALIVERLSPRVGRWFSLLWGITYGSRDSAGLYKPFFPGVQKQIKRRFDAIDNKIRIRSQDDLLTDLIQLHISKPVFNRNYLRRMAVTNFGAGHETMCSALTSIVAAVGSRPTVQNGILEEIHRSGFGDNDDEEFRANESDSAIELRFTLACIKEAQRLFPVLGMALPRTVPGEGFQTNGHFFPEGTTVGCNPISLHRNKEIFGADASEFNPLRWLESDERSARMERYSLTWGGGSRTCPGRYLAELALSKIIPTLVKEFDIQVVMPEEESFRVYFLAMMEGIQARFLPRNADTSADSSGE